MDYKPEESPKMCVYMRVFGAAVLLVTVPIASIFGGKHLLYGFLACVAIWEAALSIDPTSFANKGKK